MRELISIDVAATPAHRRTVESVSCDDCGAGNLSRIERCKRCKKDLCYECARFWFETFEDADTGDSYGTITCKSCQQLAAPFLEKARALQDQVWGQLDNDIKAIEQEWLDLK